MSRLDELIAELCPDGVEYKTIEEICNRITSGGTPNSKNQEYYGGDIPWLRTQEVNFCEISDTDIKITVDGLINSSAKWIPANCVIVAMYGATVGKVAYTSIPLTTNQACCNLEINSKIAEYKYVYYCLANKYQYIKSLGQGSQTNINAQIVKDLTIPVPPLPVQREIVRILDSFTELTAELTTELTARQKQYEYYRDYLLNSDSYPVVELASVVKSSRAGATPKKGKKEYYDGGTIPWIRTQDVRFNEITEVDSYITETAVNETAAKWIPENCVIVAISGASAGRCAINKIRATTNQHCLNMVIDPDKALYKYVYYCVCSRYDELLSRKQGARGDLNSTLILGITIPLPTIEQQGFIVKAIESFDKLVGDLNSGLPAEIAARQKQYEYYRDMLLTFKQKG